MKKIIQIFDNKLLQVLVIFIVLVVVFGILRAIKDKGLNSTIGIDGIIRKVAMIFTIVVCLILDFLININFIGFIPDGVKEYINITRIGISELFSILYILFEFLSILKNMYKCKLPIPKKLQKILEKLLKEFTSEVEEWLYAVFKISR